MTSQLENFIVGSNERLEKEFSKIGNINEMHWSDIIGFCLDTKKALSVRVEVVLSTIERIQREQTINEEIPIVMYDEIGFSIVHTNYYPLQSILLLLLIKFLNQETPDQKHRIATGFPPILKNLLYYSFATSRSGVRKVLMRLNQKTHVSFSYEIVQCQVDSQKIATDHWLDLCPEGYLIFYFINGWNENVTVNVSFGTIKGIQVYVCSNVILFQLKEMAFQTLEFEMTEDQYTMFVTQCMDEKCILSSIPVQVFQFKPNTRKRMQYSQRMDDDDDADQSTKRCKFEQMVMDEIQYVKRACDSMANKFQEQLQDSSLAVQESIQQVSGNQLARGTSLHQAEYTIRMKLEQAESKVKQTSESSDNEVQEFLTKVAQAAEPIQTSTSKTYLDILPTLLISIIVVMFGWIVYF